MIHGGFCLIVWNSEAFWFFYKSIVSNYIGFGGSVDLAAILDFVDSGHDLIIVADTNASDLIREIATECGVDFDEVCISLFRIIPTKIILCSTFQFHPVYTCCLVVKFCILIKNFTN
jgi:hypothetical protein